MKTCAQILLSMVVLASLSGNAITKKHNKSKLNRELQEENEQLAEQIVAIPRIELSSPPKNERELFVDPLMMAMNPMMNPMAMHFPLNSDKKYKIKHNLHVVHGPYGMNPFMGGMMGGMGGLGMNPYMAGMMNPYMMSMMGGGMGGGMGFMGGNVMHPLHPLNPMTGGMGGLGMMGGMGGLGMMGGMGGLGMMGGMGGLGMMGGMMNPYMMGMGGLGMGMGGMMGGMAHPMHPMNPYGMYGGMAHPMHPMNPYGMYGGMGMMGMGMGGIHYGNHGQADEDRKLIDNQEPIDIENKLVEDMIKEKADAEKGGKLIDY